MKRRIHTALASCVIVLTLMLVGPAGTAVTHDRPQYQNHKQAIKRARHRARARKQTRRSAVSYTCPMHSDIREKSRGVCPKCLMDLVAEPRKAKAGKGG